MPSVTVQIDQAGRIVLPKRLRDRFRLHRGDVLNVEVRGDIIELRPAASRPQLKRINGVLVVVSDAPLDNKDLVSEAREERMHSLALQSEELQ